MPMLTPTQARLLAVTEQLIYAGGIAATGMERIVSASGVARKSIYRYYPTKEALVAAALSQRDERWMGWFEAASPAGPALPQRVAAMFTALESWFGTSDFRGCAFINAAGEIGDANDPIRQVAQAHKRRLYDYLLRAGGDAGLAPAPAAELAHQLLILIDGAITVALVAGDKSAASRAARMAAAMLSACAT